MAKLYDINNATARHLECLANIPEDLAKRIIIYKKKRKRIRHIDELWRVRGISRKYFAKLTAVFYVPNQTVPKIGENLPFINTLSTVTIDKKTGNTRITNTKRKRKQKKNKVGRKKTEHLKSDWEVKGINKNSFLGSTRRQRLKAYKTIAKNIVDDKKLSEKQKHSLFNQSSSISEKSSKSSDMLDSTQPLKFGQIANWITNIPNFSLRYKYNPKKIPHTHGEQNGFCYYYRESEKEKSNDTNVKRSRVFFEGYEPKDNHSADLYKTCTIL